MLEVLSFIMLALGWGIQTNRVLAKLTKVKKVKVPLSWYIKNRSNKFWTSILLAAGGGIMSFIWFDPYTLDNKELTVFLGSLFGIGMGANFASDKGGSEITKQIIQDEPDDGRTLMAWKPEKK